MNQKYIPKALYEKVARQAHHRCGYCLTSEEITGMPMEIEHILPKSQGGLTEENNLWLSCNMCNKYETNRTVVIDHLTICYRTEKMC